MVLAILKACSGATLSCALAVALAAHASLHPGLLAFPLMALCYDRSVSQRAEKTSILAFGISFGAQFLAFSILLLGLSYAALQDWSFVESVYGTRLLLPDLTPNVGLWWYFFIEMFDSFRSFFLGVFWLHMTSYAPVLSIRFQNQPLAAVMLLCGVFAIFQPYANIGDAGFFLSLLSLYGHVFECKILAASPVSIC